MKEQMILFFWRHVSEPSNPPELAQNVSTKILSDELFFVFSKVLNLTVFSII